jgi:nucleoside-diphosphate-sugar epimerase
MNPPTVFVTDVSGYTGGHIVDSIVQKHAEYKLVTLVRDEKQAKIVKATWPSVETVIGDFDSLTFWLIKERRRMLSCVG